jgi:hypothetical protein
MYINIAMVEHLAFYQRLRFEQVERRCDEWYRRVLLRKSLSG